MDKREPDMVMVPVEPTEAMIAAAERLYDFPLGSSTAINSPAPDAIWSAMLSAAPSEGEDEPFMYAYECVDSGRWQAYRHQLKRADGTICPGKPLYAHPSPGPAVDRGALIRMIASFPAHAEDRGPDNEVFADIVPLDGAAIGDCPRPIERLADAILALCAPPPSVGEGVREAEKIVRRWADWIDALSADMPDEALFVPDRDRLKRDRDAILAALRPDAGGA